MNKVILMGRLTSDPEVRYSQGAEGTAVSRYSLAVNRSYKRDDEPNADFINVVAFGKRGEFAGKYFKKGQLVAVVGELRVNSYTDKDGNKRWSTDVISTEQHFAGGKTEETEETEEKPLPEQNNVIYGAFPQAPANPYANSPIAQDDPFAGSQGFMPIDNGLEGEEDLPF